jgi:cell division protein FtsB
VKKLIEHQEIHNEENFLNKLKQYLDEKEREFWKESTPIAKRICDVNVEMAEIYMKEEEWNGINGIMRYVWLLQKRVSVYQEKLEQF